MLLKFKADIPRKWFEGIAEQFGAQIENNIMQIPPQLGDGFIMQIQLIEDLTLTIVNATFSEDITAIRTSERKSEYFPLNFYYSNFSGSQETDSELRNVGTNTPTGIFFASPQISTKFLIPANLNYITLTITINKKWLLDYNKYEGSERCRYIEDLCTKNKGFYIYEELDAHMKMVLNQIIERHNTEPLYKMYLQAKGIELIALFFGKIVKRKFSPLSDSVNEKDIKKLFQVKSILSSNLTKQLTIPNLSKNAGMSESSLQKKFKQVFGKSIYQYNLELKMEEARRMFDSKKYSVSDVGYFLGYSNLSHFSNAFKRQFSIKPKDYIKN